LTKLKHKGILNLTAVIIAVMLTNLAAVAESVLPYVAVSLYPEQVYLQDSSTTISGNALQIGCPEDISTFADINECTAEISNGLNVTITAGTVASLTWRMTGATKDKSPTSGINQIGKYTFNTGVTFVDYTATDVTGKRWECSFTVVVVDNQFPILTAPKNITIHCNDRIPTPYTTLQAFLNAGGEASDNCRIMASGFKLQSEKKDKNFCPYTITRVYQVADFEGNITTVEQLIIVDLAITETATLKMQDNSNLSVRNISDITAVKSGNWTDPGTWSGGAVPTPDNNVTVPSGVLVTINDAAACNDINIQTDGTLTSGAYTLKVYGNWNNTGTYVGGTSGTVEFTGFYNSSINGNTSFEELIINKGSLAATLTINGNNSVTSGGSLTMTSGLVSIPEGGSFSVNTAAGLTIPSVAGFDITGGTLSTGKYTFNNEGLIRISSGMADFGAASGNGLHISSEGAFVVSGGTVNIAGALYNSASGTIASPGITSGINITGGTVFLCSFGNRLSTMGSLYVTPAGNFSFTGGTIVFQRPGNASNETDLNLISGSGTKNCTGGTFQFGNTSTSAGSLFSISSGIILDRVTSVYNTNLQLKSSLTVNKLDLSQGSSIGLNGNTIRLNSKEKGMYVFPISDGNGSLIPVTVNLESGRFAADAFIELNTSEKHPANNSSIHFLRRTWEINTSGITNPVYNVTATYANTDVAGMESKIATGIWTGKLPWVKGEAASTAANTISAKGVKTTGFIFTGITLDPPVVTITASETSVCFGETITLTATAVGDKTFTYAWNTDNTTETANSASWVVTPTQTTIYTVTVTDANGFTTTASQRIEGNPLPEVSVSDSLVEVGRTLELMPSTGGTWISSNPAVATVSGSTVTGISAGSATFTFTETGTGCSNTTGLVTITQPENNMLKSGMGIMTESVSFSSSGSWVCPPGVTSITVECWGGGGAGGGATGNPAAGGGGAGGAYVRKVVTVVPGTSYTVTVGGIKTATANSSAATNAGNPSWFWNTTTVYAAGGPGGAPATSNNTNGNGGTGTTTGSIGDVVYAGGNGANGNYTGGTPGGAGGGGAGSTGNGGNASGGTGGTGTSLNGGNGANGVANSTAGAAGSNYGGGGSGGKANNNFDRAGGSGAQGFVYISWDLPVDYCYGYGYSVFAQSSVTNAINALNSQDNTGAQITANNGYLDIDLTGGGLLRPSGSIVTIRLQRASNTTTGSFLISSNGSTWTANGTYSITTNGWIDIPITLSADTRYLRILRSSRTINIDAVTYPCCTNPDQPSVISGNTNPCPSSTETYSVTNVSGVTYTWSYSGTNATIASGQGTNSITCELCFQCHFWNMDSHPFGQYLYGPGQNAGCYRKYAIN
jgi:hypothetical protein